MSITQRMLPRLGPADAAIFETFVVPRYLALFGELALEMLAEGRDAQVIHLHCRTGYPDRGLALKLPGAYIYGCDPSPHAIGVSAFSKNQREAFAYIAWFTSQDVARDYVVNGGGSSGRGSLLTDKEILTKNPQYAALNEVLKQQLMTP